jgi:hypothetical protein
MSTNTWTQYVAMEDSQFEPGMIDAALDALEDWDDFELGPNAFCAPAADQDDPE